MRVWIPLLALALTVVSASATPYWTPEDAARAKASVDATARPDAPPTLRGAPDYADAFNAATWFIASFQVSDSLSADFGGIREGEHLPNIIQTDNTSESIWIFTRYYELTGDVAILPYLDASWTYVLNHPAYSEEGDSLPISGYYRYYNCGWAVRAGLLYEQVFADPTHVAYVDSCASYLANHTLQIPGVPGFYEDVNPPVLAWGAGSLRAYGVAKSDSLWTARGWLRGQRAKNWVEARPELLATEEWAMSGGATMGGILESYFDEFPAEEAAWLATYMPEMDTFSDPGDFQNAWQGWYAFAETRLEEATGDPTWGDLHAGLVDYLLAFDLSDQDGGIQARPEDTDMQDQTWVTAYLAVMGLHPLLVEATDAPIVAAASAGAILQPNRPNPFENETRIDFELVRAGAVTLDVLGVAGNRIARIVDGSMTAGAHSVVWDGRDARGRRVPAGVYFTRVVAGERADVRKVLVLR
jgi:hypothetical protein